MMKFVCDEKYENIILELNRRGWVRVLDDQEICEENVKGDQEEEDKMKMSKQRKLFNSSHQIIPKDCMLIWKNLTKIKFASVFDRYVNHFRGSSHMSNKVTHTFPLL